MNQSSFVRGLIVLGLTCCLLLGLGLGTAAPGFAQANPTPPGGQSLAAQVGFADPALSALESQGVNTLGEHYKFTAFGREYRLLAIWAMMTGATIPVGGTALLYDISGPAPKLLWSFDYAKYDGQAPQLFSGIAGASDPTPIGLPPGTWFGDERVYFAVASAHSGTSWDNYIIHLYELKADGTVVSALKGAIPRGFIVSRIDPVEGAAPLFVVSDIRGEMAMDLPNCCGPHQVLYYTWQNGALVDVSDKFYGYYFPTLGSILYELSTQKMDQPNETAARLLELLMIYDSIKQREAGWQLVQGLVAQFKASGRLQAGSYIDTVFLPAMQQLHDANKPFVAPDLANADPAKFRDFYDETAALP